MNHPSSAAIRSDEIAQRAHDIWEQSGRPDGQAVEHWLRAEHELEVERRQADQLATGSRGSRTRLEAGRSEHARGD